jgi:Glycosyl transferases group 1
VRFKNTNIGLFRVWTAARNLRQALAYDVHQNFFAHVAGRHNGSRIATHQEDPIARPLVFASYATDERLKGSHRFCGGEKLLNNLVLLLRRHGYEAWMVSLDGQHSDWLVEQAPYLSIADFRRRRAEAPDVRCVTSWIKARAFLENTPRFYFWDQELGASSRSHFPELARMMAKGRIIRTAGVNRTVQAWHRTIFETSAMLLRQLVDERHWKPDDSKRRRNRVGYFDEGRHTEDYIRIIGERTASEGLKLEFVRLQGVEREIIDQMQQCAVFLALNIGKSPLWGEGGPMTPQEAMACGTVPVCFDMNGPWEFIQQDYNGVITERIAPESMAAGLSKIYAQPERLEAMRRRCLEITAASHTMEARWQAVRNFLDLPETS